MPADRLQHVLEHAGEQPIAFVLGVPLRLAPRRTLGLRELSHHQIGRHSVGSQAASAGISMKIVQAQLGHLSEQSTHQYAHLSSGAQLRLVERLALAVDRWEVPEIV